MILKVINTLNKGDKFKFVNGSIIYSIIGVNAYFVKYENYKTHSIYVINSNDRGFFVSVLVVSFSNKFPVNQVNSIIKLNESDLIKFSKRKLLYMYLEVNKELNELRTILNQIKIK